MYIWSARIPIRDFFFVGRDAWDCMLLFMMVLELSQHRPCDMTSSCSLSPTIIGGEGIPCVFREVGLGGGQCLVLGKGMSWEVDMLPGVDIFVAHKRPSVGGMSGMICFWARMLRVHKFDVVCICCNVVSARA